MPRDLIPSDATIRTIRLGDARRLLIDAEGPGIVSVQPPHLRLWTSLQPGLLPASASKPHFAAVRRA